LKSCEFGDPLIITNAAKNWVEYSSRLFMPKTHETLIKKKIKIISARSNYEGRFPGDAKRWKHEAFLEISKSYMKNVSNRQPLFFFTFLLTLLFNLSRS
jgi:hypothetical protein